jgi:hypothetical protein
MSDITKTLKKTTKRVRKARLSKQVHETLIKVFDKLECEYGIKAEDIAAKYHDCSSELACHKSNPQDLCKYFLRDGAPCPNNAQSDTGFCWRHKSCQAKYLAIEAIFRQRFKYQEDNLTDCLQFDGLRLTDPESGRGGDTI